MKNLINQSQRAHSVSSMAVRVLATLALLACFVAKADREQDLIAVLQSSADIPAKCAACEELRIAGTPKSIPALAACLDQDRVAQAARHALDGMPFPEATDALRNALNKTSGLNKAGVIESLGWKRDPGSLKPVSILLTDTNAVIAAAAATALGRIGNSDAVAALQAARDKMPEAAKPRCLEALLRCADNLVARGDAAKARKIYSSLSGSAPEPFRTAAWRSETLLADKEQAPRILEALSGKDAGLRRAAFKVVRELESQDTASRLFAKWTSLSPEAQLAVLDLSSKFPDLGPKCVAQALSSKAVDVRRSAWMRLSDLPKLSPDQLREVAKVSGESDPQTREPARLALLTLHGAAAWPALSSLCNSDASVRPALLRIIGERRDPAAQELLLKYAAQTGPDRAAALEGLRSLAAPGALRPLLSIASNSTQPEDAAPALEAISAICRANTEKPEVSQAVLSEVKSVQPQHRTLLLPLLPQIGTPGALELAMQSARSDNAEVSRTALRTLADWPNAVPAAGLTELAKSAKDETSRTLALRAAIDVSAQENDPSKKLELLKTAIPLARPEEKRSALAAIGQIATPQALDSALEYIKDPALVEEAAQAAMDIAQKLAPTQPQIAIRTSEAVLAASKAPETVKRARLLQAINAGTGPFIQSWIVSGPYAKPGVVGADAIFNMEFPPERGAGQWRAIPNSERLNLHSAFAGRVDCVAYLKTQLIAPAAADATLLIGSDDGVKAWLNGVVVHSHNVDRGYVEDQDRAPIHLKAGTNDLLLKITQGQGGWTAAARVVGSDGAPLQGLRAQAPAAPPLKKRAAAPAHKAQPEPKATPAILPAKDSYKKIRLTDQFYAEGAYYADFNSDGKMDVVAGPFWFEGSDFTKRHEYRPVKAFKAAEEYSDNFLAFTGDFNKDGWADILCVPFPGKEGYWYENPKGKDQPWASHLAFSDIGNESPVWGDVLKTGNPQLLMCKEGYLGMIVPDPNKPGEPWRFLAVSDQNKRYQRFTHGIGFGDVNGDGRNDVLEAAGWWEQPAKIEEGKPWIWHAHKFADRAAQMYVYDVNGDKLPDVINAWDCHFYGLVWWEQVRAADGQVDWKRHTILNPEPDVTSPEFRVSQMHAMVLADMNHDGIMDILTGKRFWSHGPTGDKEPDAPAVVFWLELRREGLEKAKFVPHLIDDDSGVGTQVAATDLNGDKRPDVLVANKKGIFIHLSQ